VSDEDAVQRALDRFDERATTEHGRLLDDKEYAYPWISELASQFILFVDTDTSPGKRRIIKLSYEHSLFPIGSKTHHLLARPFVRSWARFLNILETVGLLPYHAMVSAQAVVDTESYHAEIIAPDEVFIQRAQLRTLPWEHDQTNAQDWKVRAEAWDRDRAALYVSDVPQAEVSQSVIDVYFRLRPGGLLIAALASSWITTAMLASGWYLHTRGAIARHDAIAGLIVVIPSAFAAYLVPGEHPLTRRMFRGLRAMVFATALIGFTAAASLDVQFAPHRTLFGRSVQWIPTTSLIWAVLASISAAISAVISGSWIASGLSQRRTMKKRRAPSDRGLH